MAPFSNHLTIHAPAPTPYVLFLILVCSPRSSLVTCKWSASTARTCAGPPSPSLDDAVPWLYPPGVCYLLAFLLFLFILICSRKFQTEFVSVALYSIHSRSDIFPFHLSARTTLRVARTTLRVYSNAQTAADCSFDRAVYSRL